MQGLTNGRDIMFSNAGAPRRNEVTHIALLIVLCLGIAKNCTAVPLEDFYPFNTTGGDNKTLFEDDGGSDLIQLDVPFPFFNYTYSSLYVNNNGIITFLKELKTYKPVKFDDEKFKEDTPIVAPFWADVDIENFRDVDLGESVVYRITNDSELLSDITEDVREHFTGQKDFSAKLMIIVTWYNVGFYGATKEGKYKRNTFQAVLATSGVKSFAIFNYNKTVWTTGSNSGGDTHTGLSGEAPAVVGFSSGNLEQYYLFEDSGTDRIANISRKSNIGVPGKFIFRLDGQVDDHSCFNREKIRIYPSSVSMLGREAIRVTGPCLITTNNATARIKELNLTLSCHMIPDLSAVCVTKAFFRTGDFTFEFSPNGEEGPYYSTSISSVNIMNVPAKILRQKVEKWNLGTKVTVQWEQNSAPGHKAKTLEVLAYTVEENKPKFVTLQNFSEILSQSYTFKLLSDEQLKTLTEKFNISSEISTLVMRLCWTDANHPNTLPVCIWSDVFPVRWKSSNSKLSEDWCTDWINKNEGSKILESLPKCPCIESMAEIDSGHFQRDPLCDIEKSSVNINTNCVYNSNAHTCYTSHLKSDGSGKTCCYDKKGNLMDIRDKAGAGTNQRYHYRAQGDTIVPFFSYFLSDLVPRLHCCLYSRDKCGQFVSLRPATSCQGYEPSSPAQAAGDPHLVTLDGKDYSFNGVGDYFLVTDDNSSIVIQVRAEPARDKNGDLQNATVFSNIAVAMPHVSDTIEVRKTEEGSEVLVNRVPVTPTQSTTSQFKNISLLHKDDGSFLIVLEPVSVSVTIEVTPDLLNIIVLIGEDSLKGKLLGLLGNYNGDPSDDFISRNGTVLPSSSSMRNIHFDFGLTWEVTPAESILASPVNKLSEDIHFQAIFADELVDQYRNGTNELCKANKQCAFDYLVTNKESVAKSTASFTSKFEAMRQTLDQKVVRCPYLETPTNGNKTQTDDSEGAVATFTCDPGFTMTGTARRVCQENNEWTGSDVMCAKKITDNGVAYSKSIVIIATVSGSGGILLILVVSVVVFCMRRRRKSVVKSLSGTIEMSEYSNIPVFQNPAFMRRLHETVGEGPFRIPRPKYADPSIFVDYF